MFRKNVKKCVNSNRESSQIIGAPKVPQENCIPNEPQKRKKSNYQAVEAVLATPVFQENVPKKRKKCNTSNREPLQTIGAPTVQQENCHPDIHEKCKKSNDVLLQTLVSPPFSKTYLSMEINEKALVMLKGTLADSKIIELLSGKANLITNDFTFQGKNLCWFKDNRVDIQILHPFLNSEIFAFFKSSIMKQKKSEMGMFQV